MDCDYLLYVGISSFELISRDLADAGALVATIFINVVFWRVV